MFVFLYDLGAETQVMNEYSKYTDEDTEIPQPSQGLLPELHQDRNLRIGGQSAIEFGMLRVVQHIDDVGSPDARRVVNSCVAMSRVIAKLRRPCLGQFFHFRFRSEMQTAGGARLDAGWFESHRHPVVAKRTFEDLARFRTELGDV